ncbi:hypothetical protein JJB09_03410 [Rhizobium sp. KVB221]|uniref:Uncharacterized protein n=1 Tax=Rhizobium setariae TaxID=2801340 RepID=A0A936YMQ5_9HYPH|nr:DUF6107 family protein [Rhizobium setariae]MBL0371066.1 hypothetical protein [Rhizobium setariae]
MADFSGDAGFWMERTIGASAGAAISLVYMLPRGRREAASRFLTGVISGMIFGGPTGTMLAERLELAGSLSGSEIMLSGAAAVSLCSWWGLGLLQRLGEKWAGREKENRRT